MTKIAHASGDENRKTHGGKAGDQTGKEVCIREWYNRPWNVVLHWKDPAMAERCAADMERGCKNDLIGYDQYQRNTALEQARKVGYDMGKIKKACETDCSAMVSIACMCAGIPEAVLYRSGNSATTSTLRSRLESTGKVEARTADKYTKSPDYNCRGDILLYEGHHVAVQIEDGKKVKKGQQYIPDVSHWHPVDDWKAVKAACPFIISKATQGTGYVDPTLEEFIKGCEDNGIPYWLYAYLNKGDELAQAKFLVKKCKKLVGKKFVGYIIDVEAGNFAVDVKVALDWLKKQAKKTMLYTGYSDYRIYKEVIETRGDTCAWWEARYGKDDGTYNAAYPCHDGVELHQLTSAGECPGVKGAADLNRITGVKPLKWFTDPDVQIQPAKKAYTGTYPSLANGRKDSSGHGYYKLGDGISTLKNYPTQIKRVQALLNWITDSNIAVDGQYGTQTRKACDAAQRKLGLTVSGIFDYALLSAAKKMIK